MTSNEDPERVDPQAIKQQSRSPWRQTPPLLPDVTTDETGAQSPFDDDWYEEQRPPHHGG